MQGKAHKPTPESRRQVEALSAYGVRAEDIGAVLGINDKTLRKHYRDELDTGNTKATAKVAESLYKQAVNGNIAAAIFWMKARGGWSEKIRQEHSGSVIVSTGIDRD